MLNDLDLPAALKRRFDNHHRALKRQLKSVENENAKAQKGNPASAHKVAELKRRILRAERHKNAVLMVQRKGTFGKALCPLCPICLIDHDKPRFLEEDGDSYKCSKCGLVIEVES